ncbi:C-GCAxxG-C-C family protein [Dehalobacter sp. DCM]|uniref:DVU_1555 family C-GCAxxG-C-C protein n=1 Tax=Dehalobacter sp. DCM TaxID=2907827 RepID=UPI00308208DB|nr:C-GCAxxG-C-C family protein [Dehalobacter sp. DCM]
MEDMAVMDNMAFTMFKLFNAGYRCTQIMMKMALDEEEKENEDLLRALNGFCIGIGSNPKTCGVLTAGIALLGLYAGKGNDLEYPKPAYSSMVDDYTEWFELEFAGTECRDLIGVVSFIEWSTNQEYRLKCGNVLIKSYVKIQEILRDHDFTFGSRE